MSRVTRKDVAEMAGVSLATVSRAVSGGGGLSLETRQRVLEMAQALGYRPRGAESSLRRIADNRNGRDRFVALVCGPTQSGFDPIFVDSLARHLGSIGKCLVLQPIDDGADIDARFSAVLEEAVGAVVVAAGTMTEGAYAGLVRIGMPVVLFGRISAAPGVDCVLAENESGGRQAAEVLRDAGRRRFAVIRRANGALSDYERERGFIAALQERGLTLAQRAYADTDIVPGLKAGIDLFRQERPPDAVFCVNDTIAFGVLQAVRSVGLRVPDDVAVIGFDDVPMASWPAFNLTTVAYPIDAAVTAITERLDVRMNGLGDDEDRVVRIPVHIVLRGTTPHGSRTATS